MSPSLGTLFVVSTPIGNLGDITHRALETLRAAEAVVAEDTRRTRALLSHFAITGKRLYALHAHSEARDIERLVRILTEGGTLALVTDAGTPIVSDPGDALVRAALAEGVRVVPIPGASAVLAALVGSGLASDGRFRFVGFVPRDGTKRRETIGILCETPEAVILFEAPNRVHRLLRDLAEATPLRPACVARELTKLHEEFVRGPLKELAAVEREWIGEAVIVLGAYATQMRSEEVGDAELDARIDAELAAGGRAKGIAERLAAWSGRPKRSVYERVLARKG